MVHGLVVGEWKCFFFNLHPTCQHHWFDDEVKAEVGEDRTDQILFVFGALEWLNQCGKIGQHPVCLCSFDENICAVVGLYLH